MDGQEPGGRAGATLGCLGPSRQSTSPLGGTRGGACAAYLPTGWRTGVIIPPAKEEETPSDLTHSFCFFS